MDKIYYMKDIWELPYKENGKTTKRFSYKKSGIYLIREKESKILVYVGMSKVNTYKALYRHFNKWVDCPQRNTYLNKNNYEVRIILTEKASILERRIIKFFNPRDNNERYEKWKYVIENYWIKETLEVCHY
jgi:hypothetical protein